MAEIRYVERMTWEMAMEIAVQAPNARVVYGALTCWWKIGDPIYKKGGLPCDPRGGVLFECYDLSGFLKAAKGKSEVYGRHGLRAFMAAYHGNVFVADNGFPTCFKTWDEYNDLIDRMSAPEETEQA